MRIDRVALGTAAVCLAIAGSPRRVAAQGHEVRAAVHYQWLHLAGTTFPAGITGEVSAVIRPPLAAVAEVGWATTRTQTSQLSTTARMTDFGAGLRLMGASTVRPFVQVIAGGVTLRVRGKIGSVSGSGSETWFQVEPGAGLQVDIGRNVAIAASVHVRRMFVEGASFEPPGDTAFRALAGVSVRLFN
jgi:hypothetical protein